jgi:hypothetical protein
MVEITGRNEFDNVRKPDGRVHYEFRAEPIIVNDPRAGKFQLPERQIWAEVYAQTKEGHILKTIIYGGVAEAGTEENRKIEASLKETLLRYWPSATWGRWE